MDGPEWPVIDERNVELFKVGHGDEIGTAEMKIKGTIKQGSSLVQHLYITIYQTIQRDEAVIRFILENNRGKALLISFWSIESSLTCVLFFVFNASELLRGTHTPDD
jgi:hypothetical protein